MNLPWIRRIASVEEYDELVKLAEKDKHAVCAPTHVVAKNGGIVGYASISGIPMVMCWLDTEKVKARDSVGLLNVVENHVALSGSTGLFLPVPKHSPFHPLMVDLGYSDCGNYDFYLKTF